MIFANEGSVSGIAEAIRREGLDIKMIVFEKMEGFLDFDSIIAVPEIEEVKRFACTSIKSLEETAEIFFSSGTTGPSKAVELSHATLTELMHQTEALEIPGNVCFNFFNADCICKLGSPFMHIFSDTPTFITPVFDVHSACLLIKKHKVMNVSIYKIHRIK